MDKPLMLSGDCRGGSRTAPTGKLTMQTPDLTERNYAALAALFPNAVTETIDENGVVVRAIDADVLRQEINAHVVEGKEERYQFTWPDKKKTVLLANAPIAATLRPCREESVDFDNTENLYIEGDNLDVLKLLRETYLNRVKMIYIDPPYNTGNDFIYEDDFAEDTGEFLARDGQRDGDGNRMVRNLDSNGRFHTDWLNMMYPRLRVAKDLLADDGLIAIAINDREVFQLGKLLDELFDPSHKLACAPWLSEASGGKEKTGLRTGHEYLLIYYKSSSVSVSQDERSTGGLNLQDKLGQYRKGRELMKWGGVSLRSDRPNQFYGLLSPQGEHIFPYRNDGKEGHWRWGKDNASIKLAQKDTDFFHWELRPFDNGVTVNGKSERWVPYEKIRDTKKSVGWSTWLDKFGTNADGTRELKELFGFKVFDTPKPTQLIEWFLSLYVDEECLVMDFFSGSATTAHAVMQLNAEDGGKRKFIMVQLPEKCDEGSEAAKAGYKNICEIGKERIRRAGEKIFEQGIEKWNMQKLGEGVLPETIDEDGMVTAGKELNFSITREIYGKEDRTLDIGFRVLKLDSSNMRDVYYTPQDTVSASGSPQRNLYELVDNIKPDRTAEDLLFQVMLDLGIPLSSKIKQREIGGKAVFAVEGNYLVACFDKVTDAIVTEIAKSKPYYAVFRDSGFASDATLANFEQIFKTYSPSTIRKVL